MAENEGREAGLWTLTKWRRATHSTREEEEEKGRALAYRPSRKHATPPLYGTVTAARREKKEERSCGLEIFFLLLLLLKA